MLLEDFIETSGIKKGSFASSIGISRPSLWKILKGVSKPSLKTAQKIEEFTRGKVLMKELLFGRAVGGLETRSSLEQRILNLEQEITNLEEKKRLCG